MLALQIGNSCQLIHGVKIQKEHGHWRLKTMVRKALSDKIHFVYLNLHVSHKYSLCPLFLIKEDRRQEEKKFILLKWCCMTLAIS